MISDMLCVFYSKAIPKNKKKQYSGWCLIDLGVFFSYKVIVNAYKSYPRNIEEVLVQNLLCLGSSSEIWKFQGIVSSLLFAPVAQINKKFCHRYAHLHIQDSRSGSTKNSKAIVISSHLKSLSQCCQK